MNIVVASLNPVKINAVKSAFSKSFPIHQLNISHHAVPSGVRDQPTTDEETLLGALTRTQNAHKSIPGADFYVGLEGGIQAGLHEVQAFAWICISHHGQISKSRTATFPLPQQVANLLDQGKELGDAMDLIHNKKNSKQKQGAIGILTNGLITRSDFYEQAVICALIPFITNKNQT